MDHYICTGECHGASEEPGTCQAAPEDCAKSGQELMACSCGDINNHKQESEA